MLANFSAMLAVLDAGHWEKGDIEDQQYLLPREREVLLEETQPKPDKEPTFGEWEVKAKKPGPHVGPQCCTAGAKSLKKTCQLYDSSGENRPWGRECCFYQLSRHACGSGNMTAVLSKFSTSSGVGMGDIAAMLPGKTLLIVGDSVSHQTFEAAQCALFRSGMQAEGKKSRNQDRSAMDCRAFKGGLKLCYLEMQMFNKTDLRAGLDKAAADVLLINLGLWYGDPTSAHECASDLMAHTQAAMQAGQEWMTEAPGRMFIYRGTTPQHFKGRSTWMLGAYDRNDLRKSSPKCTPWADSGDGQFPPDVCTMRAMVKAGVRRDAVDCRRPIYFIPLSPAFAARFDAHAGSALAETREGRITDCTHYCWYPRLWEVLWQRIHLALRHHASFCAGSAG